MNALFNAL